MDKSNLLPLIKEKDKEKDSKKFIQEFNANLITDEFKKSCEVAEELFNKNIKHEKIS